MAKSLAVTNLGRQLRLTAITFAANRATGYASGCDLAMPSNRAFEMNDKKSAGTAENNWHSNEVFMEMQDGVMDYYWRQRSIADMNNV